MGQAVLPAAGFLAGSRSLILASQSPRRQEILTAAGIPFTVRPPRIEEKRHPKEPPEDYVQRLAQEKAQAIPVIPGEIVLGADTVVVIKEHVLEKPRDADDATRMLCLLADSDHQVITGICLRTTSEIITDLASTTVRFGPLSRVEIANYVASGEPMDKAGAYAIQGLASKFIERIDGCYFNVVGLPIALVYRHLKELGFDL